MQIYSFDGIIDILLQSFYTGFTVYCLICLIVRLFAAGKIKNETINIHVCVNLAAAFGTLLDIISWASLFYTAYADQTEYSWIGFSSYMYSDKIFVVSKLNFWIIGTLFFFGKFRKSWILGLLTLLFINIETIIGFLIKIERDYLPSAWELEENNRLFVFVHFLVFTVFLFLIYIILHRRKKLPYPSVWMS